MEQQKEDEITFSYLSKDLEQDFPGNMTAKVTYTVTDDNALSIARIIAHLKREERLHRKTEQRFYGDLVIDYAGKCVHMKEKTLDLTKLEYDIIEFLSMNPEIVFDKERIYEKIGGYDAEGDSRVVTELIRRIRKKMKMYSEHEYIETVWGMGYKWAK